MFGNNGQSGFGNGAGFGGFGNDNAGAGDRPRKQRVLNIVPLTTKSIREMKPDDSGFKLNGKDINQVTIVGSIVHHEHSQMCNTYQLDDTYGVVSVKNWVTGDGDENDENHQDEDKVFEVGTYVRVFAQLRSFQKTVTLNVLHIRAVVDMNEITTHILECLLYKKKCQAMSQGQNTGNVQSYGGVKAGNSFNDNPNGFDAIQAQVWNLVHHTQTAEGISIQHIKQSLNGLSESQIRKAIEFLSNEGHIYSTINDDHFRSTG